MPPPINVIFVSSFSEILSSTSVRLTSIINTNGNGTTEFIGYIASDLSTIAFSAVGTPNLVASESNQTVSVVVSGLTPSASYGWMVLEHSTDGAEHTDGPYTFTLPSSTTSTTTTIHRTGKRDKRGLKAFIRYDGSGRTVAGSLILARKKPKVGIWKEIDTYECCNSTTTTHR
jgi:hypothetical protein